MAASSVDRRPGQFAEERFKARRRVWRRRVWWAFPLAAGVVLATMAGLALILTPKYLGFFLAFGLGAATAMVMVLFDCPPPQVERWRTGAEGEKRTARAVRRLLRDGWVLLNDLPLGLGNIDHVIVGPPGVFLLESKHLGGSGSVSNDRLDVRWLEDPDDGYVNAAIGPRARAAAAELSRHLRTPAGRRPWVQSIVVLWSTFDQGTIEDSRVIWTRGDVLRDVLTRQAPDRLDGAAIVAIADQIRTVNLAEHGDRAPTRGAPAVIVSRSGGPPTG